MIPLRVRGSSVLSAYGVGRDVLAKGINAGVLLRDRPKAEGSIVPSERYPGVRAFDVPNFQAELVLGDKGLRTLDRLTKLLVVAARFALGDARLKENGVFIDVAPEDIGICTSNAYGSLEAIHELDRVATLEDPRYINPAKFPNTVSNSASGYVSIWEDLRAFNVTVSNGNPGGLDAFFVAAMHAAHGRAKHVLVGGGEAVSDALCVAWQRLGLGTKEPNAAPLAEAYAYLALEAGDTTRPGVYVNGHGSAFDPKATPSLFVPSADAMKRASEFAIRDAGFMPTDIDVAITGARGLEIFDAAQRDGVRAATTAPHVELKHLVGETLGGAGAIAATVAAMALSGELVLPSAPKNPRRILVTELGINGNASAIVLSRT